MKKFRCSFCDATVSHVGEKEVESGWGRAKGDFNGKKIDIIHCPDHVEEFTGALVKQAEEAAGMVGSARTVLNALPGPGEGHQTEF